MTLLSHAKAMLYRRSIRTISLDLAAAREELARLEECYHKEPWHDPCRFDINDQRDRIEALEEERTYVQDQLATLS